MQTLGKNQRFRKLNVWEKAIDFVEDIYQVTGKFPVSEMYGLTNQLRRAATSIALNIAEGSGSDSNTEFCRFLSISLKSTYEVMCGIVIAGRLKYCPADKCETLLNTCEELSAMLSGLKKRLKSRDNQ